MEIIIGAFTNKSILSTYLHVSVITSVKYVFNAYANNIQDSQYELIDIPADTM